MAVTGDDLAVRDALATEQHAENRFATRRPSRMSSPPRRDPAGRPTSRGPSVAFGTISPVGRDDVLAELGSALRAAAGGTDGCLLLEGSAGIGKTCLLAAAVGMANRNGIAVAAGRSIELDRVAPLTALLAPLHGTDPPVLGDACIAALAALEGSRFLFVDRIGEAIERYARSRTLLVVLDDLQWADELTAWALRMLIPRLRSAPVLWLLALRPLPARSPMRRTVEWLTERGVRRLSLGPLSPQAVAELCAQALGAAPDRTALALAARAGGNPFLVQEVLAALDDAGQVVVGHGTATVLTSDLPPGFLAAVDRRLADLSVETRLLLEAGSVLGRPFSLHEAAGLLGRPVGDFVAAVNEAIDAGVVVDVDSVLAFRHDLIREAVYDGLAGSVRQALHREAITVLRTEGKPVTEIAQHAVRGARRGDSEGVEVLRAAARKLAPVAPGSAADLLVRMLDLVDRDDPQWAATVAEAVRLLASAGRLDEARRLSEQALSGQLGVPAEVAVVLGLSEALKHAGQDTAVVEYTGSALAKPGVPDRTRAQLLAVRAHALLFGDDLCAADRAAAEAVEVGQLSVEWSAVVYAAAARSAVARAAGRLADARSRAEEAVRMADSSPGEARHRHPRLWLGRALAASDRFLEADAVYELGQREAYHLGTCWSQPLWHRYRAGLRMAAGQLDAAAAAADAGVRVADQIDALALSASLLATAARVAMRRNEVEPARTYLTRARQLLADGLGVCAEDIAWALALFQDCAGEPRAAVQTLRPVLDALPKRMLLFADEPWAGPQTVRIALRAGAVVEAEQAATAAGRLAQLNPDVASIAGAAAHADGLLHDDLAMLRTAVSAYGDSPRLLDRASALEDTGLAEGRAGHRTVALELLTEALELYGSSAATRDAARVQRRLRGLGIRPKRPAGTTSGKTGWNSLTASELRVVQLVVKGMRNRQVAEQLHLSPHTVDTHLRHAFAKLGICSRVQLTRYALAQVPAEDHAKT